MTTHQHASPAANAAPLADGPKDRLPVLLLGAVGVAFGDIGTSPLSALKESFIGPDPLAVHRLPPFGSLGLILLSLMLIAPVIYALFPFRPLPRGCRLEEHS